MRRIFWKDHELAKLYRAYHRARLEGCDNTDALQRAQQAVLPADRHRPINWKAISMVRERGMEIAAAEDAEHEHQVVEDSVLEAAVTEDAPAPVPEPEQPVLAEPTPVVHAERVPLRECLLDLMTEAIRRVIDPTRLEERMLEAITDALQPSRSQPAQQPPTPAPAPAPSQASTAMESAFEKAGVPLPKKIKRTVVIVGPDSKQVGLLKQQYDARFHLTFFASSDSKDAIRSAAKNADYAISTLPHPNGPVDGILRANVQDRDCYRHIGGLTHLREFLDKLSNGLRQ